jgi:3-oxoacyl-[acyl-carrier-protein] synthase II
VLFPSSRNVGTDNRVVVTGAGVVTALGAGWNINAAGFRAGKTAMRPVTLFDVSRQRTKIAAEIDLSQDLPSARLAFSKNRLRA